MSLAMGKDGLEGPWSVDIARQDAARVEVFSNELLELFDDGHFNASKRRCGRRCGTGE